MSRLAHENDGHGRGHGGAEAERLRPLEDRLRRLNWPEAPADVRERTLRELHRKLGDLNGTFADGSTPRVQDEPASHSREAR